MKKIIPPVLFVICLAVMFLLWWWQPLGLFLDYPDNISGVVLIILGLALAKQGSSLFERRGTNIQTFDDPDVLVTDGVFRISRNPMYLGFALALAGLAIVLGNFASLLVVLAFIVITDRWYIAFEEVVMIRTFGDRYRTYQQRTRRWL